MDCLGSISQLLNGSQDHRKQEPNLIYREKGSEDKSPLNKGNKYHSNIEKIEAGLAMARALIEEAMLDHNCKSSALEDIDHVPHGKISRNPCAFHRSYLLIEKLFKLFVYEEGEPPLYHFGTSKKIYALEGVFISLMERDAEFRTWDPDQAHVYYLPFSVVMIVDHLFRPIIGDKAVLERTVVDYVRIVSHKYP